jgi:hypothetical protein
MSAIGQMAATAISRHAEISPEPVDRYSNKTSFNSLFASKLLLSLRWILIFDASLLK